MRVKKWQWGVVGGGGGEHERSRKEYLIIY